MLKSLFAAALLFTTLSTAHAEDPKLIRTISLSGHGEVHATPDLAIINMGVVSSALTAREALDANTKAMNDLMAVLKSANVESKDVSTSNFSVNARLDYGQNNGTPPKVVGYDVSNTVSVTVRKLETMGGILDKAVSSGSNQISGIQFAISNPQGAQDQARKEAVKDAKRKAELYAGAASVALGNIISLSEGAAYQPPQPMMMQAKAMSSDAGNVPIAQGEQVVAVDVNIAWEIK
jgi:uncharacterized protein